jgi:hypothetical protein
VTTPPTSQLDRAVRLFEFLARAQQSTISAPRTCDSYRLAWARDLPRHPAVHFAHWSDTPAPGDEIGHIDRLDRVLPPEPGELLATWLGDPPDDLDTVPEPAASIPDPEADVDAEEPSVLHLADHPEVEAVYREWIADWHAWAERERVERPVREAYGVLFSMQADAALNPEELELVLAVGCLAWKPDGQAAVRRHLVTAPATIDLDPVSGSLRVNAVEGPDPLRLELDMLDSDRTNSRQIGGPALTDASTLKPYEIYHGSAPRPSEPAPTGMREAVLAIVESEGPVLGTRLHTAYIRASGGQRVTRLSASAVNKVISAAVRQGLLIEDNPLGEAGIRPRTYRLPSQPRTVMRDARAAHARRGPAGRTCHRHGGPQPGPRMGRSRRGPSCDALHVRSQGPHRVGRHAA